jgi:biotin transport system substrate-specific component
MAEKISTKDIVYISLFAAIMAAFSLIPPIYVPIIPVPIIVQNVGMYMSALILGKWRGTISQLVFVILVAAGLPVLSGGRGGLGALLGVTGGYIISWPICAFLVGFLSEKLKKKNIWTYFLASMIGGMFVNCLVGSIWQSALTHNSWFVCFAANAIFVPGDALKCLISSALAISLKRKTGLSV